LGRKVGNGVIPTLSYEAVQFDKHRHKLILPLLDGVHPGVLGVEKPGDGIAYPLANAWLMIVHS
jgi:hypothetical protein